MGKGTAVWTPSMRPTHPLFLGILMTSLMMSLIEAEGSCPAGYRQGTDGRCQDINECLEGGRQRCGQLCTNTQGAYQCSCLAGYTLEADGWSCFVQDPKPIIMFSHGADISQMNEGGTNLLPILLDVGTVRSFDYNIMHERLYFIDSTRNLIGWAILGGGPEQILISDDVGILESIAVDWVNLRIYWSDSLLRRVESCSIYGTDRRTVVETEPRTPTSIIIDPVEGFLFVVTSGRRQRIQRVTLDGLGQTTIVKSGLSNVKSMVLDYIDKRIFWLDNGTRMIESSYYDGTERETVRTGLKSNCYGLTLFVDHIYWTRLTDQTIRRANKYTGHDMVVITTTYLDSNPRSIHVVHPYRQPQSSPTARLNCTTHGDCPIDIPVGQPQAPQPFLIFTNQHDIQRINFDGTDYMQVALGNMQNLVGLDYDPTAETVYFADAGRGVIERVGINGGNREVVCDNLGAVAGLALDWLRGRLYWTDQNKGHIASCSVHACIPEVIVNTGLVQPSGIVVHPSLNLIYWTDVGHPAKIEAFRHDGRHRITIATTNITRPTSITIDYQNHKLLWVDSARKVIETSNLDGTERRVITDSKMGQPFGISEFKEYLWFTEWDEDMIMRVDKATGEGRVRLRGSMSRPTGVQVVHPSRRVISGINPCSVFNGGCEQICIQAHVNQVVCACNSGYWLRPDGTTCNLDQCFTGKHNCSVNALCEDLDPGFRCHCKPGFKGDGHTCVGPTTPSSELIAPPRITYPIPQATRRTPTRHPVMSTKYRQPALTTKRSTTASRSTLPPEVRIPISGSDSAGSHGSAGSAGLPRSPGSTRLPPTTIFYPDDVIGDVPIRITPDKSHIGQCGPEYRYYCVNGGICQWLINIQKPSCRCRLGYVGERCMYVKPIIPDNGMNGAMVAAVSVGTLVPLFLIIVGIACFIHRKKSKLPKSGLETEIGMQSLDRPNNRRESDKPLNNTAATETATCPPSPVSTTKLISSSERTVPIASATLPLYQSCKKKAPSMSQDSEFYMEPAHIPTLRRPGSSRYKTPRKGAPVIMPKPTFKLAGGVAAHALLHRKMSIEREQLRQSREDYVDIDDMNESPTPIPTETRYDQVPSSRRAYPNNLYANTPKPK